MTILYGLAVIGRGQGGHRRSGGERLHVEAKEWELESTEGEEKAGAQLL